MKTTAAPKTVLASLVAGVLAAGGTVEAAPGADQPLNVLFIMADDLGWSDTPLYGTTEFYETPNIERLAERGMTFTRAYTASPLCSPTRASIMTGQTPARNGSTAPQHHLVDVRLEAGVQSSAPSDRKELQPISVSRLDTAWPTLGKRLQEAGVRTGHFGKWHLGRSPYTPLEHGFEVDIPHWFGPGPSGGYVAPWNYPDFDPNDPDEHIEDRMAEEAVDWMRTVADEPFYLQYWQFSVHAPFDAKEALIDYYRPKIDLDSVQRSPTYAAMVHSLDDAVGTMLDEVDRLGIADRTVIIFYSDNGGNMYNEIEETDADGQPFTAVPTSNAPLRGGKGSIWEGGVRVPLIVVWPGVTEPGSTSDALVQSTDFYPTLIRILGADLPEDWPIDGVDITPALAGEPFDRGPIFNYFPHSPPAVPDQLPPSISVHQDDWKLIRLFHQGENKNHQYLLFDLAEDIGEQNNLAEAHPDKVEELDALIEAHVQDADAVVPLPNPAYWERSIWTGESGPNWSDAGNWLQLPESGSGLVFAGSSQTNTWNDFEPGAVFGTISFDSETSAFTIDGNSITSGEIGVTTDPATPLTHTIKLDMAQTTGRRVVTTANGALHLSGDLSGSGNFDKHGEGLLRLTGENSFDGVLQVFSGSLRVNTLANAGENCAIGSGNRFRIGHGNTSATLALEGSPGAQTTNRFIFVGSNAANHTGSATFRNDNADPARTITFTADTFNSVQGNVNRDRTLTLGGVNEGMNTIAGVIQDNSAGAAVRLRKEGAGRWMLSGGNTFSGGLEVNGGTLVLGGGQNYSGGIALNAGGTLSVSANSGRTLNLADEANHITFAGGTLKVTSSSTENLDVGAGRNFILAGDAFLHVEAGRNLQLPGTTDSGGKLTGAGDVTVAGGGRFTPSNINNDFTGAWRIVDGASVSLATTLAEGSNARLGHPDNPVFLDDGELHFSASGSGAGNTHDRGLTLGAGGGTFVTGGGHTQDPIVTWTGPVSGEGELIKDSFSTSGGLGTLVLAGPGNHTGDTGIKAGTLRLAEGGSLTFIIGAAGECNRIYGTGVAHFDGRFDIDLSAAGVAGGDSWNIVDAGTLTATFGSSFSVSGFTDEGNGIWSAAANGVEYRFSQSTGTLEVVGEASPDTYDSWIAGFDLPEAEQGLLATPAGDGVSNLLKYALGLEPQKSSAGALPAEQRIDEQGYYGVEAIVRANDPTLSVTVQASADLISWDLEVVEITGVDQSNVPDGFERRAWRTASSVEESDRLFVRITAKME